MEIIGLLFVCAVIASVISSNKGDSGFMGFLYGLFLGPLGVILAWLTGGAICGKCKKNIHHKATKCPYCQSELKA